MEDIRTSFKRPTWLGNQEKERKKKDVLMSIKRLHLKMVTCEQQTKKCECSRGWGSGHDDCNIGRITKIKLIQCSCLWVTRTCQESQNNN